MFNRSLTLQSHTNEQNNMKQYQVTRERRWNKMGAKSRDLGNDILPQLINKFYSIREPARESKLRCRQTQVERKLGVLWN